MNTRKLLNGLVVLTLLLPALLTGSLELVQAAPIPPHTLNSPQVIEPSTPLSDSVVQSPQDTSDPEIESITTDNANWWGAVQDDIRQSEYHVTWQDQTHLADVEAAYQAPNRAHNFRTYFTSEGIRVVPRIQSSEREDWEWSSVLNGYGYAGVIQPIAGALTQIVDGNHVTYRRDESVAGSEQDLTEWYVNDDRGLTQGFIVAAPPDLPSTTRGPQLVLEMAILGDLHPTLDDDAQTIEFSTRGGVHSLRYGDLHAHDTNGRQLPVHLSLSSSYVSILVDHTTAVYPVIVDLTITGFSTTASTGLSASADWTAEGDQEGAQFGYRLGTAGDVNGDGYADVVVGARYYDNGETDEGRAFVYHGSVTGLSASADWIVESDQADALFGHRVGTAGDVNGDGHADVIVGASYYDNGETDEGRIYVFHGSISGLSTTADWITESDQVGAWFGCRVGTAGDVNGDGYADVIVGANHYDNGETDEGRVFVYHGSALGLSMIPAWVAESNQAETWFGTVGTAGDVNGDGYADAIVGAFEYDNGETDEGRVYVYYGNDGSGRPVLARQERGDGSGIPVPPWGLSHGADGFQVSMQATDSLGCGQAKLQVEACPPGAAFGDVACLDHVSNNWTDVTTATTSVTLTETISGLTLNTLYRWRARVLYAHQTVTATNITPPPNPPHGPWRRFLGQSIEADLRTSQSSAGVAIAGPTTGVVDTTYTFTAIASPPTVTLPITYTWQATGQPPATHVNITNRLDAITCTWNTTGTQTITVTVVNTEGIVSNTHTIVIRTPSPPQVIDIAPPRNVVTAPLTTNVSATYGHPMDAATVTSRTFALHGMQSGLVTATHGVINGNTIIVTPTHSFHQGELVYAVTTKGTLNVTGTGPLTATQWQFNAGEVTNRCVEGFSEVYAGSLAGVYQGNVAWGDYDSDGDLDILLTGVDGGTRISKVYQNTGGGFSEVYTGSLTGVTNSSVAWGDYDNDGDLDILLMGNSDGGIPISKVYQNTDFGFTEVYAGSLIGVEEGNVAWGDYDNDGDLDILLTGLDSEATRMSKVYQNTGNGFSEVYTGSLASAGWSDAAWGDYDNDGDLDILLAGQDDSSNSVRVYRNQGEGGFVVESAASFIGVYQSSVAWGDYDNDGDLDILFAGNKSGSPSLITKIYRNDGGGTFSEETNASLPGVNLGSLAWGDYDNDGDLDILLTGCDDYPGGCASHLAAVYRNDGGGTFITEANASLPGVAGSSVAWGDYDDDGDLDILLTGANYGGYISKIYRNDDCSDNQPPTISDIADQSTAVGVAAGPLHFTVSDTETDAAALVLNGASSNVALVPPANIVFGGSGANRTVTVTPTAGMTGTATITITVSDGDLEDSNSFVLTVGANAPPTFTSTPVEAATVSVVYTYDVTATDSDAGDVLTITATTKPGWLALTDHGGGTAILSGTPDTAGEYAVVLQVSDGEARDTQAFTITVVAFCVPLTETGIAGPTEGYTGNPYVFTAVITPSDAITPITYTWSPAPDSGQGTDSASYEWSTPGIYTITLIVENCGGPVSDTHAIVISAPPPAGDPHEPDDTCNEASSITTDGSVQFHTFHIPGDEDWVSFQVVSGTEYLVEALTPVTSTADIVLEIYDACAALPVDSQGYVFSPDVRLQFKAPSTGIYYLHLFNQYSDVAGTDVAYHLSVRALGDEPTPGALVLVAGRYRPNDSLQRNIHNVTNAVYRLFQDNGYNSDRIYYLATSLNLDADDDSWPDVDAYVSRTTLEQAITEWAVEKVGPDRAFTLYFMDHGSPDLFYLDGPNETVSPDDVNGWLNTLEAAAPGVKVNVIVEACHAGSFVDNLAKNGRVVIASTRATAPAWSSPEGAIFSDAFVDALSRGMSLYGSFEDGKGATRAHGQTPWLDDDGDGKPNRAQDGQEAARRGFAYAGTLAGPEKWPPYVVWAEVGPVQEGAGVITAEVLDDKNVLSAWAVIYKPSYTPPEPGPEMVQETLPTVMLFDQDGDDVYTGLYENFDELGGYRVVVYAVDGEGFEGRPREVAVRTGWLLYLPTVMRQ